MSITDERAKTHGNYEHLARLSQDLKARIRQEPHTLTHKQLESLEMICVKIARIVCGDANEPDHWVDISGYAELIHKRQAASGSSPQQEPPDEVEIKYKSNIRTNVWASILPCPYCGAVRGCSHYLRSGP